MSDDSKNIVSRSTNTSIARAFRAFRVKTSTISDCIFELIDNSVQSYLDRKDEIKKFTGEENLVIEIILDMSDSKMQTLQILDNGGGMSWEELDRGMQLGEDPELSTGLSEYNMGMKQGCGYLSNNYTIHTKGIGTETAYKVYVDPDKDPLLSKGQFDTKRETGKLKKDHFTHIIMHDLRPTFNEDRVKETINKIGAVYERYLESEDITITFKYKKRSGSPKTHKIKSYFKSEPNPLDVAKEEKGGKLIPLQKEFKFDVEDGKGGKREVSGKAMVQYENADRAKMGIHYFRNGRIVTGGPASGDKPELIYSKSSGNYTGLRLHAQLEMDNFLVSEHKNAIVYEGTERTDLLKKLREAIRGTRYTTDKTNFITKLNSYRVKKGGTTTADGPTATDAISVVDENKDLISGAVSTTLTELSGPASTIDPPKIDTKKEPDVHFKIDHPDFNEVYCTFIEDGHPSDDYMNYIKEGKNIYMDMNMEHPYIASLGKDSVRLLENIVHAWCLALAECHIKERYEIPENLILNTVSKFLRELHSLGKLQ